MRQKLATAAAKESPKEAQRPEIYRYHDYQAFLRDWFAYLKASQSLAFSLRGLAKKAGLATGYLSMALSGKRELSAKALTKLAPHLMLTPSERSFLESLVLFGTADFHAGHLEALDRMKRFQHYQRLNPREAQVYEYFTHWYYAAIREMSALADFEPDAAAIQRRLAFAVPLQAVKQALEFLAANGFLSSSGVLECSGDVYRVALSQYHREALELASRAIETVPREERNIRGHTFAIKDENYAQAKEIVEEAIRKVQALGADEKNGDSVYQLEVALFPLTKKRRAGK